MPNPLVSARDDQPLTYLPAMTVHCFSEAIEKPVPLQALRPPSMSNTGRLTV
jgi:hypothetical protein